jgi:hypothetical protein
MQEVVATLLPSTAHKQAEIRSIVLNESIAPVAISRRGRCIFLFKLTCRRFVKRAWSGMLEVIIIASPTHRFHTQPYSAAEIFVLKLPKTAHQPSLHTYDGISTETTVESLVGKQYGIISCRLDRTTGPFITPLTIRPTATSRLPPRSPLTPRIEPATFNPSQWPRPFSVPCHFCEYRLSDPHEW